MTAILFSRNLIVVVCRVLINFHIVLFVLIIKMLCNMCDIVCDLFWLFCISAVSYSNNSRHDLLARATGSCLVSKYSSIEATLTFTLAFQQTRTYHCDFLNITC